jgi:hypothetical protein
MKKELQRCFKGVKQKPCGYKNIGRIKYYPNGLIKETVSNWSGEVISTILKPYKEVVFEEKKTVNKTQNRSNKLNQVIKGINRIEIPFIKELVRQKYGLKLRPVVNEKYNFEIMAEAKDIMKIKGMTKELAIETLVKKHPDLEDVFTYPRFAIEKSLISNLINNFKGGHNDVDYPVEIYLPTKNIMACSVLRACKLGYWYWGSTLVAPSIKNRCLRGASRSEDTISVCLKDVKNEKDYKRILKDLKDTLSKHLNKKTMEDLGFVMEEEVEEETCVKTL